MAMINEVATFSLCSMGTPSHELATKTTSDLQDMLDPNTSSNFNPHGNDLIDTLDKDLRRTTRSSTPSGSPNGLANNCSTPQGSTNSDGGNLTEIPSPLTAACNEGSTMPPSTARRQQSQQRSLQRADSCASIPLDAAPTSPSVGGVNNCGNSDKTLQSKRRHRREKRHSRACCSGWRSSPLSLALHRMMTQGIFWRGKRNREKKQQLYVNQTLRGQSGNKSRRSIQRSCDNLPRVWQMWRSSAMQNLSSALVGTFECVQPISALCCPQLGRGKLCLYTALPAVSPDSPIADNFVASNWTAADVAGIVPTSSGLKFLRYSIPQESSSFPNTPLTESPTAALPASELGPQKDPLKSEVMCRTRLPLTQNLDTLLGYKSPQLHWDIASSDTPVSSSIDSSVLRALRSLKADGGGC